MTTTHATGTPRAARSTRRGWVRFIPAIVGTIVALLFVSPLAALLVNSFKGTAEFAAIPPTYFPQDWTWESYQALLDAGIGRNALNSATVAVGTVALTALLAAMAGFGFARFRFPGRGALFMMLLATLMIPFQSIIPSVYTILSAVHLTDSLVGLILVYTGFVLPFCVFTMRAAFGAIPVGVEEAAVMDGASTWRMLRSVMLPMVVPGLVTVAVYTFFNAWNEFLAALIFTTNPQGFTLPVALANLQTGNMGTLNWGVLETGAVISALPCIAVFLLLQKYYVAGLTAGAVKG